MMESKLHYWLYFLLTLYLSFFIILHILQACIIIPSFFQTKKPTFLLVIYYVSKKVRVTINLVSLESDTYIFKSLTIKVRTDCLLVEMARNKYIYFHRIHTPYKPLIFNKNPYLKIYVFWFCLPNLYLVLFIIFIAKNYQ